MEFNELTGDATAFEVQPDTIHFVPNNISTLGFGGSGFIVAIQNRFPKAYEQYVQWFEYESYQSDEAPKGMCVKILGEENAKWQLGNMQCINVADSIYVCNFLGQKGMSYFEGMPPGRYEAIEECLRKMNRLCEVVIDKGKKVQIEACKFGGMRSGLSWKKIFETVQSVFKDTEGIWNTYSYEGPNA